MEKRGYHKGECKTNLRRDLLCLHATEILTLAQVVKNKVYKVRYRARCIMRSIASCIDALVELLVVKTTFLL